MSVTRVEKNFFGGVLIFTQLEKSSTPRASVRSFDTWNKADEQTSVRGKKNIMDVNKRGK